MLDYCVQVELQISASAWFLRSLSRGGLYPATPAVTLGLGLPHSVDFSDNQGVLRIFTLPDL